MNSDPAKGSQGANDDEVTIQDIRLVWIMWGTSHPGWPQKRLIGNSRFNRKTYGKIGKINKTYKTKGNSI